MNTRTPEQEAAITAAIEHLDQLFALRRAQQSTLKWAPLRIAIVEAATAIVAEPRGRQMIAPPRSALPVRS